MPVGHQAVGERLYVFSTNSGHQSSNDCVIEAHGEQRVFNNTFTVPLTKTVSFYVPHGAPQAYRTATARYAASPDRNYRYSDALLSIATGVAQISPPLYDGGDACPDYSLSKLQASTGGCTSGAFTNWLEDRSKVNYHDIERMLEENPRAYDIVTIRNRRFTFDITLENVLAQLHRAGYGYTHIHCSFCCSFCRVPTLPWKSNRPAVNPTPP